MTPLVHRRKTESRRKNSVLPERQILPPYKKRERRRLPGTPVIMMQQAPCLEQSHGDVDTGGDNGHHAHQLDQDIQRGAGRILEGVAHRCRR